MATTTSHEDVSFGEVTNPWQPLLENLLTVDQTIIYFRDRETEIESFGVQTLRCEDVY
jgi:hypothetical protein